MIPRQSEYGEGSNPEFMPCTRLRWATKSLPGKRMGEIDETYCVQWLIHRHVDDTNRRQ
jgi:hypothetical protein